MDIPSGDVSENAKLLGLTFQSSDSYLVQLYLVAAVLAILVAMAGIFMISGSLNSNIANRIQFSDCYAVWARPEDRWCAMCAGKL